jgi:hypothetical protein
MNWNKIRAIIEVVRRRDALPTDDFGNLLPPEEMIAHLGLSDLLTAEEQRVLRHELTVLAETKAVIERLEANMS